MWLKRLRNLDMTKKEHRQRLIDTFINSVYVYDDKLEYTINYKDGTETITFEDASRALAEQESGSDMESSGVPRQNGPEDVRSSQRRGSVRQYDTEKLKNGNCLTELESTEQTAAGAKCTSRCLF